MVKMELKPFDQLAQDAGLQRQALYTAAEVGRVLRLSPATVRKAAGCGKLKWHRPLGSERGYVFAPEWIDEWVRGRREAPEGA
ncbi:hypothetical protein GMI70_02980 [Eggerthellaceae bacterium zg-893]|nr:hypothetical protein [Eggerthellaceae bacterium zg-893]